MDEAFYRQLGAASHLQALHLMGTSTPRYLLEEHHSGYLERTDDNFLTQVTEEPTRRGALLDLILTKDEELTGVVKALGSISCSDYEVVEFRILRGGNRANTKSQPWASGEQTLTS